MNESSVIGVRNLGVSILPVEGGASTAVPKAIQGICLPSLRKSEVVPVDGILPRGRLLILAKLPGGQTILFERAAKQAVRQNDKSGILATER
jgi:hypothetical protein